MKRYDQALSMALQAHAGQVRKGTQNASGVALPYITHPVAVSALVLRHDGDADQAIAGLLHDVLEDGGEQWRVPIRERFGARVAGIVEACTDGVPDASGKKMPWKERKLAYIASFADKPADALLVAACDKLHNLRSILADRQDHGDAVFERFTAGKDGALWYYAALVEALAPKVAQPLAYALSASLGRLVGK